MDKLDLNYTTNYYEEMEDSSRSSATSILTLVSDIIKINSVVDVGCGNGVWLSVCKDLGATKILGLDGHWVKSSDLLIAPENFKVQDLNNHIEIDYTFDLAISVEVAEHLYPESAENFVKDLTMLAPVILFSAAIPNQGGTHHINEQWQAYWINLFKKANFHASDYLRQKIWDDQNVADYYSQNAMLFVCQDYLARSIKLQQIFTTYPVAFSSIVHPRRWLKKINQLECAERKNEKLLKELSSFRLSLKNLIRIIKKHIKSKNK